MATKKSTGILLLAGGLLLAGPLVFISWTDKQPQSHFGGDRFVNDTTPEKSRKRDKVRNIEEAIEEVEKARQELSRTLEVDMARMQKELETGLREIDAQKIRMEVEKSLKSMDMEKIQKELKENMEKMELSDRAEFKEEMKRVEKEMEKARIELEKVKEIDFKNMEKELAKVKVEMKDIKPRIEAELKKAEKELEKAKESLKETKTFIDDLDKAGLIDKDKDYTIEHKKGELFINGQKQSEATYKKFENYLNTHKEFKIKKEADEFDMQSGERKVRI